MISLAHLKLIKCSCTLLDLGAQISFSLLSLNTAHDVAQGTAGWNAHLLTPQPGVKSSIFTHKNVLLKITSGLLTALQSVFSK